MSRKVLIRGPALSLFPFLFVEDNPGVEPIDEASAAALLETPKLNLTGVTEEEDFDRSALGVMEVDNGFTSSPSSLISPGGRLMNAGANCMLRTLIFCSHLDALEPSSGLPL